MVHGNAILLDCRSGCTIYLTVHWHLGQENCADFYTKYHPAAHHTQYRPMLVVTMVKLWITMFYCKRCQTHGDAIQLVKE